MLPMLLPGTPNPARGGAGLPQERPGERAVVARADDRGAAEQACRSDPEPVYGDRPDQAG